MAYKNSIERHPVLTYFVLVYLIAWGGILLILQALAVSGEVEANMRVGLVALPMLIAPAIAGVTVTALVDGRAGLRAMWSRMTRWQVGFRWYLVALAVLPLGLLAILYTLAFFISPAFTPVISLLGLAGLAAGFLEEIGWTGFATQRLLARWNPLVAGVVVGLTWGIWHGLADYAIRGSSLGGFWPVTFGLFVLPLTAWRILMMWVYDNTRSGFVAQLMHCSYTGSLALFVPIAAISPSDDALVYLMLAGGLWIGVGLFVLSQRRASTVSRLLQS